MSVKSWDLNWTAAKPHAPVVLSSADEGRAIVLELEAGEQLDDHEVHERAWLIVVSGEVAVTVGGAVTIGGAGFLFEFAPGERHEVLARSYSRLLLLLTPWPGVGHPSNHG